MHMPALIAPQLRTLAWSGSRFATVIRQALEGYRCKRRQAATARILEGLDDRTLRDIGIDRSEISSVVATRCRGRRIKFDFDALVSRGW